MWTGKPNTKRLRNKVFCLTVICFFNYCYAQCPIPAPPGQFYEKSGGGTACDVEFSKGPNPQTICDGWLACRGLNLQSQGCLSATSYRCDPEGTGPALWTLEGCPSDQLFNEQTGECQDPCPPDGESFGEPSSTPLDSLCPADCLLDVAQDMNSGPYEYEFAYTYTGEFCDATDPDNDHPPIDCAGGEHIDNSCQWDENDTPSCGFGTEFTGTACECPPGTLWDGEQCANNAILIDGFE